VSHFSKVVTKIKDKDSLVDALVAMGFAREHIEVHDKPVKLNGYEARLGNTHEAEIVIRKKHLGNSYNDIGFRKKADGTYEAALSDMGMRNNTASRNKFTEGIKGFNKDWMNKLNQQYSVARIRKIADSQGYALTETFVNGEIVVECDASY
jgi:hypothetical protein